MARRPSSPEDATPHEFPESSPRDLHPTSDIRFVMWEMGKMSTALERVSDDLRTLTTKVETLESRASTAVGWAKGLGVGVIGVGIVLSGAIALFTWIFDGKIDALRDQFLAIEEPPKQELPQRDSKR
ncbi:hypothetical protein GCM10009099_02540 [Caenispirillum bisanense]